MVRILLVEDIEINNDMLDRRLMRKGFEVKTAPDGEQAVTMAQSVAPDVILMNMNLPLVDGWTAARQIRSDPETATIPIIALLEDPSAGEQDLAIDAGCDDFEPRPVDLERLVGKIKAQLAKNAAQ